MNIMIVAFVVDLSLYALAGVVVVRYGKRFLPEPLRDMQLTVVLFVLAGALITMATFPHWAIYPK